jgi:hypothetical protein
VVNCRRGLRIHEALHRGRREVQNASFSDHTRMHAEPNWAMTDGAANGKYGVLPVGCFLNQHAGLDRHVWRTRAGTFAKATAIGVLPVAVTAIAPKRNLPPALAASRWRPGQSGNPSGHSGEYGEAMRLARQAGTSCHSAANGIGCAQPCR